MLPKTARVNQDTAWCEICVLYDHDQDIALMPSFAFLGYPLEITRSCGIAFWTPAGKVHDQPLLTRWLEIRDLHRHPGLPPTVEDVRRILGDPTIAGIETTTYRPHTRNGHISQ